MFRFHSWPILHSLQLNLRRDAGKMALRGRGGSSQATYGKTISAKGTAWYQTIVTFPPKPRGVHVITKELQAIEEMKKIKVGLATFTIQHTSASLSANECWDSEVRDDMEMMLNRIAPENAPYRHTLEGSDDMPAHVKCSLMGSSVTLPITDGKLNIGQWQGVWLCEHRDNGGNRKVVVTLQGAEV